MKFTREGVLRLIDSGTIIPEVTKLGTERSNEVVDEIVRVLNDDNPDNWEFVDDKAVPLKFTIDVEK